MDDVIEKVGKNDQNFKTIDLSEKNCNDEFLKKLLEKLKDNCYVGNILLPSNINSVIVTQIENKIKQNNWKYERFPNYFVHLLISSHVYSVTTDKINQIVAFENNDQEFSHYNNTKKTKKK